MTTTPTPCSVPPCDAEAGEPCDRHQREAAHAEGEHAFCGPDCTQDTPDDGLRQRIEAAARTVPLRLGPNALAMAQRGEPIILNYGEAAALADVVLPLVAAERADGRADGLREAAAALQAVIDRDRADFPHQRGQSWIALGGAREIILNLLRARADAITQERA